MTVAFLARFNDAMINGTLDLSHMQMSTFPQVIQTLNPQSAILDP